MIRLDSACDLSPFTDKENSRYALGAIHYRPPCKAEVAKRYRELRKSPSAVAYDDYQDVIARYRELRQVGKHQPKPACVGGCHEWKDSSDYVAAVRRYRRLFRPRVRKTITAQEAYSKAHDGLRGTVEATDGKMLVSVPCLNGDEFPQTPGAGKAPKDCLILASHVKDAIRRIPKRAHKDVLKSVRLTSHSDNAVVLSTTDCERATDETVRLVDGRFPHVDEVWPKDAPIAIVCLDPSYLERIAKHAKQHCSPENRGVELIIRGDDVAVEFRYRLADQERDAKALLMPLCKG